MPDNFQCQGILLNLIKVGQGPTVLAVGASRGCFDIFLSRIISLLWEVARYRLISVTKIRKTQNILSINRNLTIVNLSVFLEHQLF